MDIKRKTLPLVISAIMATAGLTVQAAAAVHCSVEAIEQMPAEQQMKQYSLCVSLMEKRIALLKKQKEARKLMEDVNDPANTDAHTEAPVSVPTSLPPVTSQNGEPVVVAVEGAGDRLRATLQWPDGSTARVSKGVTVKGYEVLDVTIDGIKARRVNESGYKVKKGDVVFIPVGASGSSAMAAQPVMGAPTPISSPVGGY